MPIITNNGGYVPEYVLNSPFLLVFIIPVLIVFIIWGFKRHFYIFDYCIIITFSIYLYNLIDYTIMPINLFIGSSSIYRHINLGQQVMVDFSLPRYLQNLNQYITWYNLLGNLILLFPLGIYLTILYSKLSNVRLGITIFCFASIIELLQLIMNYFYLNNRIFDISDIILNLLGGIVGILIIRITIRLNLFPKSKLLKVV